MHEECATLEVFFPVPDKKTKPGLCGYAYRTCPEGISIEPSKTRIGELGAWAMKSFGINSVFGPYKGLKVYEVILEKKCLTINGGKAWKVVQRNGKLSHYVDGSDENSSNWLRYVNCARNKEEQNLIVYQYEEQIYYRAQKNIQKGTELLVWFNHQTAEQPEPFDNTKCGVSLSCNGVLQREKSTDQDRSVQKRLKCDFCRYSTNLRTCLNYHSLIHTEKKQFECSYCLKKFNQKSILNRHIRIHTDEKPFECSYCLKRFGRKFLLDRHIRIHTEIRPFECPYCFKNFKVKYNLSRHIRIHTKENPLECSYCFKIFFRKDNLRCHIRTHTKKKLEPT